MRLTACKLRARGSGRMMSSQTLSVPGLNAQSKDAAHTLNSKVLIGHQKRDAFEGRVHDVLHLRSWGYRAQRCAQASYQNWAFYLPDSAACAQKAH